jgi:Flp pilus assembly pilin Flp
MKKMNEVYVNMMNKVAGMKKDETGSQTLEWIGIAAVIVIVVGLVSTAFSESTTFGSSIVTAFENFISTITGE